MHNYQQHGNLQVAQQPPFSKRLKEARIEAKLSQKKLGMHIGLDEFVASARLNRYETGRHNPDLQIIKNIADVLKVPTAYFYAIDDDLAELIKIYGRISKTGQRQLVSIARKFIKNN